MLSDLDKRLLSKLSVSFDRCVSQGASIEVGLSGGLDSIVLLHLLNRLRNDRQFDLCAAHIHHGLQVAADDWPRFCGEFCQTLHIPFRVEYVQANTEKIGVEAGARRARYQAFVQSRADIVALAHHQDDQVETFMLSALRGSGIRGLSAMPELRALGKRHQLWRPLLEITREELSAYAQLHCLQYIDDPSNSDESLLRNWLRNTGLPIWRERLPFLDRHIMASVKTLQEELAVLEEVSEQDKQTIYHSGFFDCVVWRKLTAARQSRQLLFMVKQNNLGIPTQASLNDFRRVLNECGNGSAEWCLHGGKIYAYQNRLFCVHDNWLDDCVWLKKTCLSENSEASLNTVLEKANFKLCRHLYGLREDVLEQVGNIRAVSTDDMIELTVGHKKVRKLLQECKIPPFVRPYWPVITNQEGQCIAVANLWVNPGYACLNGVVPYFEKFNCFVLEPK
ncbi:tRNA lysidine(34) synthetase TilS [Neisseria sp. 83E34]|uniref:tRNA lysidine(34) synthetase TilS n=1 Tax=Neisseria sp. 83E34 TaxID=1692264 RepID=UPI0006CE8BE7|nr:tRNA lysidine(34) synthetase TilS [Neisseria sp. 83E34]